ncbi:calcium-binding protein [Sinorhizobium mexicanum]|nr:calcium-binding protein [Sinorhizobium mexicanum]
MAVVAGGTMRALNFNTLQVSALFDYDFRQLSSTSARYFDDASNYTLFQGSNLTFNASGQPTGGIVTSVRHIVNGGVALSITGFSIAATTVYNRAVANDTQGLLALILAGADNLTGTPLADVLLAYAGNDTLRGGTGKDTLDGGAGLDTADYGDKTGAVAVTLAGAANASVRIAGVVEDTIRNIENVTGGTGADVLIGDGLANRLIGAAGNDSLSGAAGNDTLRGGAGKDTLDGGAGLDTADYGDKTGAVAVTLAGAANASVRIAGVVEDTIRNIENVTGGAGADVLIGDGLANRLIGAAGNDSLSGAAGNDTLRGGAGKDTLDGGAGVDTADYSDKTAAVSVAMAGATNAAVSVAGVAEDTVRSIENITGGAGADVLTGDGFANRLAGGVGNDTLRGGGGNDTLVGGAGNDNMDGGTGLDTVDYSSDAASGATHGVRANLLGNSAQSGLAADTVIDSFGNTDRVANIRNIIGTQFADTIFGGAHNNVISGGVGNDFLDGERGNDTLIGGAGNDTFRFHTALGAGNVDTIGDFSVVADTIQLENAVFTAFTATGAMSAASFSAHILYNSGTGALSYDANGTGTTGGVTQFATLGPGLALSYADFVII